MHLIYNINFWMAYKQKLQQKYSKELADSDGSSNSDGEERPQKTNNFLIDNLMSSRDTEGFSSERMASRLIMSSTDLGQKAGADYDPSMRMSMSQRQIGQIQITGYPNKHTTTTLNHIQEDSRESVPSEMIKDESMMSEMIREESMASQMIRTRDSIYEFDIDELASESHASGHASDLQLRQMRHGTRISLGDNSFMDISSSSSDGEYDADDDLGTSVRQIVEKAKKETIRLGILIKYSLYDSASIIWLVQLNERMSSFGSEPQIQQASQLLAIDPNFYGVSKQLIYNTDLEQISQLLYRERNHPYAGVATCVTLLNTKSGIMALVGNCQGYIRAFDLGKQLEKKPLFDAAEVENTSVVSMEVTENGQYLVAAYSKGTIILWSLAKYSKAHVIRKVAMSHHQTTFTLVKNLHNEGKSEINLVTAETMGTIGHVKVIRITKSILGLYSHQVASLYESSLQNVASIRVLRPSTCTAYQESDLCRGAYLTAIAGSNCVVIVRTKPFPPEEVYKIQTPGVFRNDIAVQCDWGFGLTPSQTDQKTMDTQATSGKTNSKLLPHAKVRPLLAIVWDQTIQLLAVDDQNNTKLVLDGYFCSDQIINSAYFVAESILVIVEGDSTVSMLYTAEFEPGNIFDLLPPKQTSGLNYLQLRTFKTAIERSTVAILDKNEDIIDVQTQRVNSDKELLNSSNTICRLDENIVVISKTELCHVRLLPWQTFLNQLKYKETRLWITIFKVALDIFNGVKKGYTQVPCTQEGRRATMLGFMRRLLLQTLKTVLSRKDRSACAKQNCQKDQEHCFSVEWVSINCAIEFCLKTDDFEFLVDKVNSFLASEGLEDVFLNALSKVIITGQLIGQNIPEQIVIKLIERFQAQQDISMLEKVILNIIAVNSHRQCQQTASKIYGLLEKVSTQHSLISALIQLQTNTKSSNMKKDCTPILNLMLKQLVRSKQNNQLSGKIGGRYQKVTKQDLQMVRNADKKRKHEIEQSKFYIGYRLIWVINLFLKGKKIPSGWLTEAKHKAFCYNIVDFVTQRENLEELVDFDPQAFFSALGHLFCKKPWRFLKEAPMDQFAFQHTNEIKEEEQNSKRRQARNANKDLGRGKLRTNELRERAQEQSEADFQMKMICKEPVANSVLLIFKQCVDPDIKKCGDVQFPWTCFLELLLNIVVLQHKSLLKWKAQLARNSQIANNQTRFAMHKAIAFTTLAEGSQAQKRVKTRLSIKHEMVTAEDIQINYFWIIKALKSVLAGKQGQQETLESVVKKQDENTNVINQKLIIDTLKAVRLKEEDVAEIKALLPKDRIELLPVKIALFENNQEYDQAFLEYLNNGVRRGDIFTWLTNLFDQLQEQEADPDYFLDENVKTESKSVTALQKLRERVKQDVLKLAQINSEQTMKLVEEYLNQGNFQETLIMKRFGSSGHQYEEEQFNYLKTYLTRNEEKVKSKLVNFGEIKVGSEKVEQEKYEKYIVLFTMLLCKLQKNEIEDWVGKCFFPTDNCLKVCREYNNLMGVAILSRRSNRPLEAIQAYIDLLGNIPINKLLEQIKLTYFTKEPEYRGQRPVVISYQPQFLPDTDRGAWETYHRHFIHPSHMRTFDLYLGRACDICTREDLDREDSIKGWLLILNFLRSWTDFASQKVIEAIRLSEKEVNDPAFASLQLESHGQITNQNDIARETNQRQKNDAQKAIDKRNTLVERFKQFLQDRVNYILRYPKMKIPLKTILEEQNLTLSQIQHLCMTKQKHNDINMRIQKCQQKMLERQLMDVFRENFVKMSGGYSVEPSVRKTKSGKLIGNTICNTCKTSIVDASRGYESVYVYQCAHQFHGTCLAKSQRQKKFNKCPICVEKNYLVIKEQKEEEMQAQFKKNGLLQTEQSRLAQQDDACDSEDETNLADQNQDKDYDDFQVQDTAKDLQKYKMNNMERRMDEFNSFLDDINLELREFEEEQEFTAD